MIRRNVLATTGFIVLSLAGPGAGIAQDTALVRAFHTSSAAFTIVDGHLKGLGADVLSLSLIHI